MSLAEEIKDIIYDEAGKNIRPVRKNVYNYSEYLNFEKIMSEETLHKISIRIMKAISQRLIDGVKDYDTSGHS